MLLCAIEKCEGPTLIEGIIIYSLHKHFYELIKGGTKYLQTWLYLCPHLIYGSRNYNATKLAEIKYSLCVQLDGWMGWMECRRLTNSVLHNNRGWLMGSFRNCCFRCTSTLEALAQCCGFQFEVYSEFNEINGGDIFSYPYKPRPGGWHGISFGL